MSSAMVRPQPGGRLRRVVKVLVCLAMAALGARAALGAGDTGPLVEVVKIDGTINAGMAHKVQRAVAEARANGAHAILAVMSTNGGLVDDANDIRDALADSGIKTIAFVAERAWSAGALISLACDKIYMAPGSSMGAALPVNLGAGRITAADAKVIAALRSEFESLAEAHHRDPKIAAAMADPNVVIVGLKAKGEILSLSAARAQRLKFIDGIAPTDEAALALAGIHDARLAFAEPTWGERIAQFVADPVVSGLLLTIGFLGLIIEFQTAHLIAGIIGTLALALFFGAHLVAGASNWLILVLFALGVLGLLFELHVLPGHGIAGTIGSLLIITSIVLAFGGAIIVGIEATALSFIAAVVIFAIVLRFMGNPESAFMRRFAFASYQSPAQGYVAALAPTHLVGHDGIAESLLRPAGVALIDGARYQVQTKGEFIPAQTPVRVERVEGAKIIVIRA